MNAPSRPCVASAPPGLALGLDIGTSGVRAAVLDAGGAVLGLGSAALADPRAASGWWAALEAALATLRRDVAFEGLRVVAVDGTSGTLLAVDAAGHPLTPASLYNDTADPGAVAAVARAAPSDSPARGATSPLARALGLQGLPGVARLLHQADWIAGRLLGAFRWSDENNALKTGYDPVARRWPDWIAATGLDVARLPEVQPAGLLPGRIDAAMARALGLPAGLRVAAGTTDGCAAFLAAGAAKPGEAVTSLGSSLVLKLACARPVADSASGVYSHRLGETWLAGGASNSGGAALARYLDAAELGRLSARIDPSRPSALAYYPLPGTGERFPLADPTRLSQVTPRPADDVAFLQGLLEGIARIEAEGYRRLVALGAPPVTSVRSVGGGARNATWTAIRARVLGVPMLPAASEDAAVGAARLALRALASG